jgi:thioredoxin 1
MSNLLEINDDEFQTEVLESEGLVLVDFGAVWCSPCKMLDPVVEELAGEWGDSVKVVKLDVDNNPNIAMNYQVMGVPTLMLFKGGAVLERLTGFMPKPKILGKLNPHIIMA